MKNLRTIPIWGISLYFVILLVSAYSHASQGINDPLGDTITQLIAKVDPNLNIGVYIINVDTDKTLYQRHINRTFIPASNLKLFTVAAALLYLGADYKFSNELLIAPDSIEDNRLVGNVYLRLSGDPSLSKQQLAQLIHQLNTNGITRIEGDFIIDSDANQDKPYGPGWMIEDAEFAYGAQLMPVMLDQNRLQLTVKPAESSDRYALIDIAPPTNAYISLVNQLLTVKDKSNCRINYHMETGNILHVSGCITTKSNQIQAQLAIRDPLLYSKAVIITLLEKYDINLTGVIKQGQTQALAELLAEVHSEPLSTLTIEMLKDSNNLFTEAIFLKLGAEYFSEPGRWENGSKAVKEILQEKITIDLSHSNIVDGSGLSRYNLLSPAQIIYLLVKMNNKYPSMSGYTAAFPVAGQEGTLENRLTSEAVKGRIQAKTGTMSGVVSLAGYLSTADNQTVVFCIMMDGFTDPVSRYQQLADSIVEAVAK